MIEKVDLGIKRAAILARVSSDEQVKGTSLTTQVEDCRKKARELDHAVRDEDIFIEEGVSGGLPMEERPTLQRLFDLIEQGTYDAVISYSPDRLSRNLVNSLLYNREAKTHGCQLIYVTQNYDDSLEGDLMKNVMAIIAEYEHGLIRRRTLRGRMKVWSEGRFGGGRIPYGYSWSKEQGWKIVEPKAAIVRKVFYLYVQRGLSLREIARTLNDLHVPTPRSGATGLWRYGAVRQLMCQPCYVGVQFGLRGMKSHTHKFDSIASLKVFAEQQKWIPVRDFPPILVDSSGSPDVRLWEAAQQKRSSNRKGGTGNRTYNWPLQGRMRCAQCGYQMRCRHNHNRTGKRVYYCHTGKDTFGEIRPRCETPRLFADQIERAVAWALTDALSRPEQIARAAERFLREMQSRKQELVTKTMPVAADLESLRAEIRRANLLYVKGRLSEEDHDQMTRPLLERLKVLEAAMSNHADVFSQIKQAEAAIKGVREALSDGTLVARVSRLKGLELLRRRSEDERIELRQRTGKQFSGVLGIDQLLHKQLQSGSSLSDLLNLLSIRILVDHRSVRLEGLVPWEASLADLADPEVSWGKTEKGSPEISSLSTAGPSPASTTSRRTSPA